MTAVARVHESDPFTRRQLDSLARSEATPCVSLYLPTHRAGANTDQDPLRLRNLLAGAERELVDLGWRSGDAEELIVPARQLLGDREFWRHQSDGLALFIAPDVFRAYRTPVAFEELAVVSTQFHVGPMLRVVADDEVFWVLALSQNAARLLRGTRDTVIEIDTDRMPASMADALAHEDPEKQLQVRSSGPISAGQFHGHGGGGEDQKAALERYFRAVDRGVTDIVDRAAPLVLAAVSYYAPIYRAVSRHPRILDDIVGGSPDGLSAAALREEAWPIIEREVAARRAAVHDRFARSRGAGRAAEKLADVATAASEGRVDLLILARGRHRWATHNGAETTDVHDERQPGDVDLLDDMAQRVLRTGGDVLVMDGEEMPAGAAVAAILRHR